MKAYKITVDKGKDGVHEGVARIVEGKFFYPLGYNAYLWLGDEKNHSLGWIVVVPDPGAEKDAAEFCKAVKGRWLSLPEKIDDMIVAHEFDGQWLKNIEKQARRIR